MFGQNIFPIGLTTQSISTNYNKYLSETSCHKDLMFHIHTGAAVPAGKKEV